MAPKPAFFLALALLVVTLLGGCGQAGPGTGNRVQSAPAGAGSLVIEPEQGAGPYLTVVDDAKHSIDVNSYLLTDGDLVEALINKAEAGVKVRVIVAGNPYRDSQAVAREKAGFAGTPVRLRLAPPRFEGRYVYDHAKYLVVDPGQGGRAVLGSSNLSYAGLGGGNREYDYDTTDPTIVGDLAAVFEADWAGRSIHLDQPGPLVISPAAENQLVSLIQGARQKLSIESEELGNDRPVLDAVLADLKRGVQVEVVLPGNLSAADRRNAAELAGAGARVRYLDQPYPHAKLIIADGRMFMGSENISVTSLNRNREVGIVTGMVTQAAATFAQDFQKAGR